MKLIHDATKDHEVPFVIACPKCKSTMEATKSDFGVRHEDRDGPYYRLKCMACKAVGYYHASIVECDRRV